MDKKEINKRNKLNFFARITRSKAKEEIAKRQEKLGRPLSKEEKHSIVARIAEQARIKTYTWALLGAIGIGTLGAGYIALSEGGESPEQHEEGVSAEESFREGLKVPETEQADEVSYTEEQEWIINEIDNLETEEDVLAWWKNVYIEEYEKITGDDTLKTDDIKVRLNNQTYIYKLDNGQMVTHGFDINTTEAAMKADGQNYTTQNDVDVYQVRLKTDEIIDCMTTFGEKVIPGENYNEMKDYDSVLEKLGKITGLTYKLMDDTNYEVARIQLKEAVKTYYAEQAKENGAQESESQQSETPQVEDDGR